MDWPCRSLRTIGLRSAGDAVNAALPHTIGVGTFVRATVGGLQWRMLVLWLAGLLLPTAVVSLPVLLALGRLLDQSMLSASLATGFNASVFADVAFTLTANMSAINGAALIASALALLISPLLTGMVVFANRSGRQPGFAELLHGGIVEYGRLLRMLLWAGVLLGLAASAGVWIVAAADKGADHAIVESEFAFRARVALYGSIALLALVHVTIEAGRAQFAADDALRSALRAWWRGCKQLLRRPLSTLGFYLLISAIGYVGLAALARWRIGLPGGSGIEFMLAFAATQLISLASAWMRIARLYALTEIARAR